jgi:hypothetical protein
MLSCANGIAKRALVLMLQHWGSALSLQCQATSA